MNRQQLIFDALVATDTYLGIEDKILSGDTNPLLVRDFITNVDLAKNALYKLGELADHEDYIRMHVDNVIRATAENNPIVDYYPEKPVVATFADYINTEQNDEFEISDSEIDTEVETLDWEDIIHLYDDDELVVDDAEDITEALTAQGRIMRKMAFARTKSRRETARRIKLRRQSSPAVLKRRAALAARKLMYRRMLRGRDKSQLSPSEKTQIEIRVHRLLQSNKGALMNRLVNRTLPRVRQIERQRLAKR